MVESVAGDRSASPVLRGAAAVACTALLLVVAALRHEPTVSAQSAPPATSGEPAPASPQAGAAVEWRRVAGPVPEQWQDDISYLPMDIASDAPGMLVALWHVEADEPDGPLWYSATGAIWSEAQLPGADPGTLAGLVATPDGFLAVGDEMVWWSVDGIAWEARARIPDAHLEQVAATGDRLVVAGSMRPRDAGRAAIWTSDDAGWTWDRTVIPQWLGVERVAVGADGTILTQVLAPGPDGRDLHDELWAVVAGEPARVRLPGGRYGISSLSWTELGFMATIDRRRKHGGMATTLWHSRDGRSWTRSHAVDGTTDHVHDADGELLWFGHTRHGTEDRSWVATSTAGVSWRFDPTPALDRGTVNAVTTVGDRVWAIGTSLAEDGPPGLELASLWMGERAVPVPSPSPSPIIGVP